MSAIIPDLTSSGPINTVPCRIIYNTHSAWNEIKSENNSIIIVVRRRRVSSTVGDETWLTVYNTRLYYVWERINFVQVFVSFIFFSFLFNSSSFRSSPHAKHSYTTEFRSIHNNTSRSRGLHTNKNRRITVGNSQRATTNCMHSATHIHMTKNLGAVLSNMLSMQAYNMCIVLYSHVRCDESAHPPVYRSVWYLCQTQHVRRGVKSVDGLVHIRIIINIVWRLLLYCVCGSSHSVQWNSTHSWMDSMKEGKLGMVCQQVNSKNCLVKIEWANALICVVGKGFFCLAWPIRNVGGDSRSALWCCLCCRNIDDGTTFSTSTVDSHEARNLPTRLE